MRGVSQCNHKTMKNYKTLVKTCTKLLQIRVHLKNKIKQNSECNVIYETPCRYLRDRKDGMVGRDGGSKG